VTRLRLVSARLVDREGRQDGELQFVQRGPALPLRARIAARRRVPRRWRVEHVRTAPIQDRRS